jgi:hypothetical protein
MNRGDDAVMYQVEHRQEQDKFVRRLGFGGIGSDQSGVAGEGVIVILEA